MVIMRLSSYLLPQRPTHFSEATIHVYRSRSLSEN